MLSRIQTKGRRTHYSWKELFAPVVSLTTLRCVLALAAATGSFIHQQDVSTAFLNASLPENQQVYMHQPEWGEKYTRREEQTSNPKVPNRLGKKLVIKLLKGLYGLKQSPYLWANELATYLVQELGMQRSVHDACLYYKRYSDSKFIWLLVYVDDLLWISPTLSLIKKYKKLMSRKYDVTDEGEASWILGMHLSKDEFGSITLSQRLYVKQLIDKHLGTAANATDDATTNLPTRLPSTPLPPGTKLSAKDSPPKADPALQTRYRSLVGGLIYLLCTRADIANAVHQVSRFMHNPGNAHMQAALHILRYLANTMDVGVTYNGMRSHGDNTSKTLWGYSTEETTRTGSSKAIPIKTKIAEAAKLGILISTTTPALTCPEASERPFVNKIVQQSKIATSDSSGVHGSGMTSKTQFNKRLVKSKINGTGTDLVGVSDASLADNPDTRRSSCGHAWFLNGGFIAAKATQQTVVALSSCEAEYISACMALKQGLYLRMLLAELGFPQTTTALYTDNSANIDLSLHSRLSPRTAHIDTRYHFVKLQVQNKNAELKYLNTESIPADALTKSLDKTRHLRHSETLQNQVISIRND